MTTYETILLEQPAEGVRLLRLNRPQRLNAISPALVRELDAAVAAIARDDDARALVIAGDERAFSSGADLKEPPPGEDEINDVFKRLEAVRMPTIAAVRGWCIAGGLELAMTCDLRVAAHDVKIGDWHVKINSIGGAGATVRLVRLVGLPRAKELVYTGAAVDGEEALRIGLVNRVCEADDVEEVAVALAAELAGQNPVTVAHAKRSLNAAVDLPLEEALSYSLELQDEVQRTLDADFGAIFEARQRDRSSAK